MAFDNNKWQKEYRKGIRLSKCWDCGEVKETEFTSGINTRKGKLRQGWLCLDCYADAKLNHTTNQRFKASNRGRPICFPKVKGIYGLQNSARFYRDILPTAYR